MNNLKLFLFAAGLMLSSVSVWASHPSVLSFIEFRLNTANKTIRACVRTHSGWSDSQIKCSDSFTENDPHYLDLLKMDLTKKPYIEVSSMGFTVKDLLDSLIVSNCKLNEEANLVLAKKEQQIKAVQAEMRAIRAESANYRCQ